MRKRSLIAVLGVVMLSQAALANPIPWRLAQGLQRAGYFLHRANRETCEVNNMDAKVTQRSR